ncbi:uncharacterized protein LOC6049754 [Culex quinquefasciatus]|uniref:uncharacterized protein LOC6049754 n=1 Tax=Culex quinquefasciatus TaxID=7176 RepID=UPI0018E3C50F|nr:uncharacterized protein LOC6049754 [Culex quinquefasciatus]
MEPTEDAVSIQNLPDEMLEKIFSKLSLEYRKSASLVCHRWNPLAIRPADVLLVVDCHRDTVETYRQYLLTSSRSYKHLLIAAFNNSEMESLAQLLVTRFRHALLSLQLDRLSDWRSIWNLGSHLHCLNIAKCFGDHCDFQNDQALHPLPNLRHLKITAEFLHLPGVDLPSLTPNLTSLSVEFQKRPVDYDIPANVLQFLSPRLTQLFLKVDWSHDNLDFIRPIWQHRFPLLTRFKCDVLRSSAGGYANSYELEHFLKSCTSLRAISLDGLTQEARFFRNLSLACVNLRELSFRAAILGQEHFLHLCQMPQLRRLYVCQAKLTFRTANFQYPTSGVRDLVLERADIWNVERFNRFIAMAFPALVSLRMNYFKSSAAGSLRLANLQRLEELHLEEHGALDLHLLEDFATLPKLHSVKLGSPQFDVLSFQPRPRLDHIRALGLRTQFNDEYLLRLAELFPRLASLQLCGRPLHTEGGREAVRKLLPGCDLRLPVEGEIVPLRYFTPFSMMVERRCCDDD